jgi:SulP family sulfate permease
MKDLFKFDFKHIRGDIFGGMTAAIVALPLALAFGVSSGLGAAAGLYGAFAIGLIAAFFGGTPTQISGPTAPMTVISAICVTGIVGAFQGDLERALPSILLVFFIAGILEALLGVFKIGGYIKYIPYPVVSGFMTGIGVIILITQIPAFFGYSATKDSVFVDKFVPQAEAVLLEKILEEEAGEGILVLEDYTETAKRGKKITKEQIRLEAEGLAKAASSGVIGAIKILPRAVKNINWLEMILALITIFIIYGFKRITTAVPSSLVALVGVSIASYVMMNFYGMKILTISDVGEIPLGFPPIHLDMFYGFSLGSITPYLGTALALAFLGAIDSLLTSVVADNMTKTRHNSNQELIGQGIGNSVAALFGGIPGAGATIRTVVNINAGGKTRISGMIHGLILLLVLLVLGPIASQIPLAVLAGILITVGIGVMDYRGLKAVPKMPRADVAVMFIVLFFTVFVDLIQAVGIGMVLSALMFMKKMGDVTSEKSSVTALSDTEDGPWKDELDFPVVLKEEIYIKHLNGPLFFGYTNDFRQMITTIPLTATHVIIRMERVPYIDQSGLFTLEEVLITMIEKGKIPLIVGVQEQPMYRLESIDIVPDLVSRERVFDNFQDCMKWVNQNVDNKYNSSNEPIK